MLAGTEICVFDAYGTLFDFNSAVARHRAAIGPKAGAGWSRTSADTYQARPAVTAHWAIRNHPARSRSQRSLADRRLSRPVRSLRSKALSFICWIERPGSMGP